ncbi:helix-turn-helix transcriptional regulator [Vibrio gazogenes]|uniref:AraC-type DNA-binding protein n=1 Tax=Vibrio gazogenes DSM 21264 = NBRC 103151 TaxID=1123492 RepID=A0A1M4ULG7_VIBGA|nr:helix-turn-helix transcriptional regulator [Vibrio gazogenes]USP15739.1 helix-turn-helix transcriptional regulator [Vibrio gazogenes]SHE57591.1 AraC-type DNA-binding protein [Vibrio gazogenes DSM 21264] [Vibrio gazogenes DSM 21264 = NBRC 103151]SJN52701.1 HTH-type transcriptional repressor of iron proteins A [Vibrio gazogenes]
MSNITITDLSTARNVDNVPRPVVALSATSVTKDWEQARHQHHKAQLIYSVRGILNCEVEDGVWIVPPQCAVWIPGNLPHSSRGAGETECYCLFVEPDAAPDLPKTCCTISVSPLLRELLLKVAGFPKLYELGSREDRLIATLLDELAAAPVENLHLPMPHDPRLRHLAEMLLADPTDKTLKGDWATRIGMSERNMSRLLLNEIGMSFGRWRRQLHVILALQRLTKGESVQTVALELGYENASGFVTMFRKAVGKPPARYISERMTDGKTTAVPAIILSEHGLT